MLGPGRLFDVAGRGRVRRIHGTQFNPTYLPEDQMLDESEISFQYIDHYPFLGRFDDHDVTIHGHMVGVRAQGIIKTIPREGIAVVLKIKCTLSM